ncbi:hypothetical protein HQN84_04615 [Pedobacter steynii]|nr:hypothetical protein [Pedobacter steynii]NQX38115.1 hypothetical protein [Pedobacter steynii]
MKYFIFLIVCLLGTDVFAQHNNKLQFNVMPPSPVASKFTTYLGNEPNLSSGTVSIPIDLYNIELKDFSLPIKMTYSTSGISITDTPFPYGYGWVSNINPRITRKVLGRADERYPFKDNYTLQNDWINRNNGKAAMVSTSYYYSLLKGMVSDKGELVSYQLYKEDLYDGQKDIFTINLPHKSITFLIKKELNGFKAYTYGNYVKIDLVNSAHGVYEFIDHITVTDEDGTIYRFGAPFDAFQSNYVEANGEIIITSWLLREIEAKNHQKIKFIWANFDTSNSAPLVSVATTVNDLKSRRLPHTPAAGESPNSKPPESRPEVSISALKIDMDEYTNPDSKMLTKIEFPLGSVDFSYLSRTLPLVNNIKISDFAGSIIKNVDFAYGEWNAQQDQFLLKQISVNDDKYKFEYNTNRYGKGSTSIDLWGFYNGKVNQSHVPKVFLKYYWEYAFKNLPPVNNGLSVGFADKSVDELAMKAFMLEKIIYPTGGYSTYDYEPHQFSFNEQYLGFDPSSNFPNTPTKGGGLRVKTVKSYHHDGSLQLEKSYKYGIGENGLARIKLIPTLNSFIDEIYNFTYNAYGSDFALYNRLLTIKGLSDYSSYDFGKSGFWYDEVTEYSLTNKRTVKFIFKDDVVAKLQGPRFFQKKFTQITSSLFQNGPQIKEEINYLKTSSGYSPLLRKNYDYEWISDPNGQIQNMLIDRRIGTSLDGNTWVEGTHAIYPAFPEFIPWGTQGGEFQLFPEHFSASDFTFNEAKYYIDPGIYRLKSEQQITYALSDSIINIKTFSYNPDKITYPKTVESISSKGGTLNRKTSKYPWESSLDIYQLMVQKNMLDKPIEELFTTNQSTTLLSNNYAVDTNLSNELVFLQNQTIHINAALSKIISFKRYDLYGNPLEFSIQKAPSTTLLWGYKGQYPIAEIVNASYSDVLTKLGGEGVIDQFNNASVTEDFIRQKMAQLRSGLPNAQITSFIYKPLVGITSKTNPNGRIEYYEYDGYQRLKNVKDQKGNVLKNTTYHYKP